MLVMSIVVGAIAGLIAGLATLPFKSKSPTVRIIVAAAVFILARGLLMIPATDYESQRETDQALGNITFYQAIKRADPAAYERLRQSMIEALKQGKSEADITAQLSGQVAAVVPPYLGKTSDQAAVHFLSTISGGVKDMDGDSCYALLYPGRTVGDHAPLKPMSAKDTQDLLNAMGEVMNNAIDHPQAVPSADDTKQSLQSVLDGLSPGARADAALISKSSLNADERNRACQVSRELFAGMLKLPEKDSGQLIRQLMGTAK